MFRIWPTNAQSTSHSYAYSQQTSTAKYYLSASLEMNGKVFMNHSQVESRILGSFIPRNDAFQTTWVPSAHTYQTSAIDQHQHLYAPAPQQPSLPQPPIYPIRRRTQPEQANVIQKIQISSLKKEGNGRPAAIEMSTGTDGGHLPVARPVYQNSPPTASAKSGHTASAPSDEQNLSAQLQELREALDREAQDHADAIAQLRGAHFLPNLNAPQQSAGEGRPRRPESAGHHAAGGLRGGGSAVEGLARPCRLVLRARPGRR